jgi:predicted DNA-binding transcriptional regulator AlpA
MYVQEGLSLSLLQTESLQALGFYRGGSMTTSKITSIKNLTEETLLSRQEVAKILHIGLSTLDSLITEKELPRTRIKKRVFVLQQDLENYILANRNTGGAK